MEQTVDKDKPRVLLLTTARSYRNTSFVSAAQQAGVEIIQAVDIPQELSQSWAHGFGLDFTALDESVTKITSHYQKQPFQAILAVDDSGTVLAAAAAENLGLVHNSTTAARAVRDKLVMRRLMKGSNLNTPQFCEYSTGEDLLEVITQVGFPCVVKPRNLNGSRGVIRTNNRRQLESAVERTASIVRAGIGLAPKTAVSLLIEAYIPGDEVALEGILEDGRLQILALFDKPDPLEGPFFEETIYITPSRLSPGMQSRIATCAAEAARNIGLQTGPVHAEFRLNQDGPWILEIAGRSIGGLCSQVLQFGTEGSLEEIILRQACGLEYGHLGRALDARGVMMIPIPGAGLLRNVRGQDKAKKIPYIDGLEITAPLNNIITPLPEGDGYLGFIFSSGPSPEIVEDALRKAHKKLTFKIDALLPLVQTT